MLKDLLCVVMILTLCLEGTAAPPTANQEASFSVTAQPDAQALSGCMVLFGHGWFKPVCGGSEDGQSHWTGRAPVNCRIWTRAGFRFIPSSTGRVNLSFANPDGSDDDLALDDIRGEGTTIENGSLDIFSNRAPQGWHADGIVTGASGPRPSDGGYAVLRPGASISREIELRAGIPVIVSFSAMAIPPPDRPEMPRLPSSGTRAHEAIRHFQRGMNLGNHLEAPPGEDWGANYSPSDFEAIRAEGFDHVRIPCAWHHHAGPLPEFIVDPDFFTRTDSMVFRAVASGLSVVINWHHFDRFTSDPHSHLEEFLRVWEQIASRYADAPGRIAFELLNEPRDAADTETLNKVYERTIPIIRSKAPGNTIIVGPSRWNHAAELDRLRLPAAESNIIVTIHDYDPFLFTHQGASWTAPLTDAIDIRFPGPAQPPVPPPPGAPDWVRDWIEAYNTLPTKWNPCGPGALDLNLRLARDWSDYFGRPIYVGEWGCIAVADTESRRLYMAAKHRAIQEAGLAWAIWDWKSNFRYWNTEKGEPMPGLREALR